MIKCVMGRILNVDLSTGTCEEEAIPDQVYEQVLAGLGLAAHLLNERIPAGADPLGPDNILGFMSGLLTGTSSLFTGRWQLVGKSPLTGGWGDANCGGNLAPAIKRSGYDGILVSGVSDRPVYLLVNNGEAEIRDASHLWGRDATEAEEALIEEVGVRNARVAVIGQAGEKLSLISGVCNDRGRIAARSGLGAVMGAKRLKAVVLAGKQKIGQHDPAEMKRLTKRSSEQIKKDIPMPKAGGAGFLGVVARVLPLQLRQDGNLYKSMLRKWGTCSMNQMSVEMGDAPVKNWAGTHHDFNRKQSRSVNPDAIIATEQRKYHCYACPLGCGGICSAVGPFKETHKPEYESTIALGALTLNQDVESIYYLNELLNRAGMDTISAGSTVAFAIECYENGLLTKEDTDGLELTWGNTEAIVELIKKMIAREGIGDLLADGSKLAAERIGKMSERYAMHAGGQDLPMHDGRMDPGFALHYSVEPTPGRHTIGALMYYEMYQLWRRVEGLPKPPLAFSKGSKYIPDRDKATMAAACAKYVQLFNGAGLCMFGAFVGTHRLPLFEWLNAATGWSKTANEYMEMGAHIQTLRQSFNVRHGIEPKQVKASERSLGRPVQTRGANRGRAVELEPMMRDYWEELGWDPETGKPQTVE
jgi:aldehyde:ferredoxin oxidoreductase